MCLSNLRDKNPGVLTAPGQHQIECLDHIDRTGRVDTDNIFRRRVARRDAGGMDDLRHVTEGSGELRQRLHLRAIRARLRPASTITDVFPSSLQIAFSHAAVTACHDRNCFLHV